MKTSTFSVIFSNIVKETEKAILVTVEVAYNCGTPKARDLWFPKSVVTAMSEHVMEVKDWFVRKVENENAFKGYRMEIVKGF